MQHSVIHVEKKLSSQIKKRPYKNQKAKNPRISTENLTTLSANYMEKGVEYFNSGNHQKAIENLSKHIELHPKDILAYITRGAAYNDSGDHTKAIENFNKAIELNPNSGHAYFEKGN